MLDFSQLDKNKKTRLALENDAPEVLLELGLVDSHVPAMAAGSITASQVVERALADADRLLLTSGPISCVDRLHTALHGYLKDLNVKSGLTVEENSSVTQLFKLLRAGHPKLQHLGNQDKDI